MTTFLKLSAEYETEQKELEENCEKLKAETTVFDRQQINFLEFRGDCAEVCGHSGINTNDCQRICAENHRSCTQ